MNIWHVTVLVWTSTSLLQLLTDRRALIIVQPKHARSIFISVWHFFADTFSNSSYHKPDNTTPCNCGGQVIAGMFVHNLL